MTQSVKIGNPTRRDKAVRVPGALAVVKKGTTRTLDVDWDATLAARYRAAGLEFDYQPAAPAPKTAAPAPAAPAAVPVPPAPQGGTVPPAPAPAGGTDRASRIAAVMATMTEDQKTTDGKPEVNALNALMGEGFAPAVTAAERDQIWTSL